jgi:Trypsin-like peptidase domain
MRALVAMVCLMLAFTQAHGREPSNEQIFPKLLRAQTAPQVLVDYVLSLDVGGTPQRIQGSVDGVLISADGVVLVSANVLNPSELFRSVLGEGSTPPNMRSSEFKVRLPGQGEPLRAEVVNQDKDVGVAWLRISNPVKKLPFVDLAKAREPLIGEAAYSIGLVGESNAYAAFVEENRVMGKVEVPFKGYIVAPAARILFGADGRPIGYAVIRYTGAANLAAMGGFKSFAILLPGPRLLELTERALKPKL